jgi:hypothetical protein
MKIIALVRSVQHPQYKDPNAPQLGDIVDFRRADTTNWKQFKDFAPVYMDLNVPCGDKFYGPEWLKQGSLCDECEFNDPAKCDIQKYLQSQFSIVPPHPLLKKRMYQVKFTPDAITKSMIDKGREKSDAEKSALLLWAKQTEQPKTIIYNKATEAFESVEVKP